MYRDMVQYKMGVMMIINFVQHKTKYVYFETSSKTTNDFDKFKAKVKEDGFITVSREGCTGTIYRDSEINVRARLWHDLWHLELNAPFDAAGEELVAEAQCQEMTDWLRTQKVTDKSIEAARNILYLDIMAQVEYYERYARFCKYQEIFIMNKYLNEY